MYDTVLGWRFPNKALLKQYGDDTMPQTADNLSRDLNISREGQRYLRIRLPAEIRSRKKRRLLRG